MMTRRVGYVMTRDDVDHRDGKYRTSVEGQGPHEVGDDPNRETARAVWIHSLGEDTGIIYVTESVSTENEIHVTCTKCNLSQVLRANQDHDAIIDYVVEKMREEKE